MIKGKIIAIALTSIIILSSCGNNSANKDISDNETSVQYAETETTNINDESIVYAGPVNPNDPATENTYGDFIFMPIIYMQDYDVEMPNGKSVAESGNLITCLSMLSSYYSSTWITPDVIVNNYPNLFDDNGNIKIDDTLETFCSGTYVKSDYDFYTLSEGLANEYDFALVRIPNPSIYGNLSTYLIIEGIADDYTVAVRDPNKSNIETYAIYSEYDYSPRYNVGDLIIALGENTQMYLFSEELSVVESDYEAAEENEVIADEE